MATLTVRLMAGLFICGICSTDVKTSTVLLDNSIRDHVRVQDVHRSTEPGVRLFHQHEDCDIIVFSGHTPIQHTLSEDDGHTENITLQFIAFGKRFLVDLHLTRTLFGSAYSRKIVHDKGKDFRAPMHRKEHCYYQGQIRNIPLSAAALSSCDGFRGYVSDGQETYHIHPVNGSLHRIFRNSDMKDLLFKCGTESNGNHYSTSQLLTKHRKKRSIRGPYDANKYTRYVELYIVNDYRTFDLHGNNATTLFKRSQDIANIVNSLYRQLNIYVVLVGVEVWSTGDKITITTSAEDTMKNFLRYRKERINPYHPNDNAQLITGITFDHGVMGKAFKGPICTHQSSGGVSMDYDGLVTLVANTMAHELGHNFGMEHDNNTICSCPQDRCIMAAISGRYSPKHWSSCSQNSLQEAFDLGMDYCLRNPPVYIFDGPVCGNGFVEDGEECDCGLAEDCTDRCCNATSCQLHPQAQCGTGQCCDLNTCKPKEKATLCREPMGECDLPEFCNGTSEFCPPDVYVQDGVPCSSGQSYCYNGQCRTHNGQCKLLWGDTGRVSDPFCFQQLNVRGNVDGNCGYNWTTGRFKTCERENVLCGLLHCVHLNEKLMFWRDNLALDMRALFLTRGNTQYVCRSTMLDVGLDMPDPGLVPDGAKCEDRKICIKQTCTPLIKLKIPQCPDCHGNGVCNSNGNCHCHVGQAPPLCDRPGYGGSIDSGPASNEYAKRDLLIGLLVLFLMILLLVLAVVAYCHRQQLRAWWKLGPQAKFSALKKPQRPSQPPRPSNAQKRWSSGPYRPGGHLEISGPLLDDAAANDNSVHSSRSPVPVGPPPPIYKPSANKTIVPPPKPNPPAAAIPGRGPPKSGSTAAPRSVSSKPAVGTAAETSRPSHILPASQHSSEPAAEQQQQRNKEVKKPSDRPSQNPPLSPTKGGRKVVHSQSMQEPQVSFQPGEKIVKRQSFRGAEISNPILVSTTNRDSDVFADFELDKSGVIARPVTKQHSIHGSKPVTEAARDGHRGAVRRSQSDRPLSPKRPVAVADSNTDTSQHGPPFLRRPLPPEPVLESEAEPLYMNAGLSDLEDLKAHISSAFEGLYLNLPAADSSTTDPTPVPDKAASGSSSGPARASHSSAVTGPASGKITSSSNSVQSKRSGPPRPSQAPTAVSSKPPERNVSKATPLERVLNNPVKSPFTTGAIKPSPGSSASSASESVRNNVPGKTSFSLGPSVGSKNTPVTSVKPSTTSVASSRSAVRGPFGSTISKTASDGDTNKGPSAAVGSQIATSASVKTPSSAAVNNRPATSLNKGVASSATSKEPVTLKTGSSATSKEPVTLKTASSATSKEPVTLKTGQGPAGNVSTAAKVPVSTSKFPGTISVSNAGKESGSSTVSKGIASNAISRGPPPTKSSVSKVPGTASSTVNSTASSTANSTGRGTGRSGATDPQRSGFGASRPQIASKPGTNKIVRSYNF